MKMRTGALKGVPVIAGVLAATLALGGCSTGTGADTAQPSDEVSVEEEGATESQQATYDVTRNAEFGHADVHVNPEEFAGLGFEYGDSLDLVFSNGYEVRDIPFYNGFYSKIGEPLVLDYPGREQIWITINFGDPFWDVAGLGEGDTVTMTLNEKGKYADVQNARNIEYTNEREDYESDEVFANFREVPIASIADNVLYRSASMCDTRFNRAGYVDKFAEERGIAAAIDLADDLESVEEILASPSFESDYFKKLYDENRVILVDLNPNFSAPEFHTKLVDGLNQAMELPTPWLVFCVEGKDRTGTVCMILEALAGASYEEIENDFMITYANYYGITRESDPERYDVIVRELLHPMIAALFDESEVDVDSVDLVEGAKNYLKKGGMTEDEIARLKDILTGAAQSGEVQAE